MRNNDQRIQKLKNEVFNLCKRRLVFKDLVLKEVLNVSKDIYKSITLKYMMKLLNGKKCNDSIALSSEK